MDKNEQQIEHLAQRVRSLEMECQSEGLSPEIRSIVEDFDLVPVSDRVSTQTKLTGEIIRQILENMGYNCKQGQDYVLVETDDGERIQITYSRLPIISVTNGFVIEESEESLKGLRNAAFQITDNWDMVKAAIDDEEKHLAVYLHARHIDAASFEENICFYIEYIIAATDNLRELHRDYERDRILGGFKTKNGKQVYS